jgi:hypothetical protein
LTLSYPVAGLKYYCDAKLGRSNISGYIFEEYVSRHIRPGAGAHKGEANLFILALNSIITDAQCPYRPLPDNFRSILREDLPKIAALIRNFNA